MSEMAVPQDDLQSSDLQAANIRDLRPLTWILEQVGHSVNEACKAVKLYVHEHRGEHEPDVAAADARELRLAHNEMHRVVGALEMVEEMLAARMARAMEAALQRLSERPGLCTQAAAEILERGGFALVDYLRDRKGADPRPALGLFPLFSQIQELAGADRIHPADLWPRPWHMHAMDLPSGVDVPTVGSGMRRRMDRAILQILRDGNVQAARQLKGVYLSAANATTELETRTFHVLCAAFFEALEGGHLAIDLYVKRTLSRILLQYATVADGTGSVSQRLLLDLLFFCEQAQSVEATNIPLLRAVADTWQLAAPPVPSYVEPVFGLYDPQVLLQCRRGVQATKESWSALVEDNARYLSVSVDHLRTVAASARKLSAVLEPLAAALLQIADQLDKTQRVPTIALGMEMATTLLFLEAILAEFRPRDAALAGRVQKLADRLRIVADSGEALALEPWMETLYRHVSDRQNIDTVVGELRLTLAEVEQHLDQFFRRPEDRNQLNPVPGLMTQMRGVLSVLGLEHAVSAVSGMRADVEHLREPDADTAIAPAVVEKLGNSLGVLGFLLDTLGYQPALARKLFYYDKDTGELKFAAVSVGTTALPSAETDDATAYGADLDLAFLPTAFREEVEFDDRQEPAGVTEYATQTDDPVPGEPTQLSGVPSEPDANESSSEQPARDADEELLDVFIGEAREVVADGRRAVAQLRKMPADTEALTVLRRAFHTMKGSARMVDLAEFSAASWSLEQLLNSWLAKGKPATDDLCAVAEAALSALLQWLDAVEGKSAQAWRARPFDAMADALRIHGERRIGPLVPETLMSTGPAAAEAMATPQADPVDDDVQEADAQTQSASPSDHVYSPEFPSLDFVASEHGFTDFDDDFDDDGDAGHKPDPAGPVEGWSASGRAIDMLDLDPLMLDEEAVSGNAQEPMQATARDRMDAADDPLVASVSDADGQSQPAMRQVGHLQLSTRLYEAYVEESSKWSDRLLTELSEWADAPDETVPDDAHSSAHSLTGSSATIGFVELAQLTHEIERALARLRDQGSVTPEQIAVLCRAAEAVRESAVAFGQGRLQSPDAATVAAVKELQPDVQDEAVVGAGAEIADAVVSSAAEAPEVDVARTATTEADDQEGDAAKTKVSDADIPDERQGAAEVPIPPAPFVSSTLTLTNEIWPIFEEEATELLDKLAAAMRRWSDRPEDPDVRARVLRVLHTLKGSARLAEATELGDLVHETESTIEKFVGADGVHSAAGQPPSAQIISQVDQLYALFDRLCRRDATTSMPLQTTFDEAGAVSDDAEVVADAPGAPDGQQVRADLLEPVELTLDSVGAEGRRRMVRVRSYLLDHLMTQLGELVISRASLEEDVKRLRASLADLAGSVGNLRRHLREVEMQAETQIQTRIAQRSDADEKFDPLEFDRYTRLQELTRMLAEAVDDVATVQRSLQRSIEAGEDDLAAQVRQSRELQHALLRARMIDFDTVSERLHRLVRQVADETHKHVNLQLVGGDMEIDRSILDRLMAVFEHLLRNSIVHGIAMPGERVEQGLNPTGQITLTAEAVGPDVIFEVKDDGVGLDLARIRESAQEHGKIQPEQELSERELMQLVFEPSFTTATEVTELAGRGIGLDVVRSEVRALGGHVTVRSQRGAGTTFRIVVPATQAVTQVTLVRMGAMVVGIPTGLISSVQDVAADKLTAAYGNGNLRLDNEELPFFWLGALFQHSQRGSLEDAKSSAVLICSSAEQKIAVHVDEVVGEQEVVIKPLGPQLARLPGLLAITVLVSGSIALIYNPVALANVYDAQVRTLMTSTATDADTVLPLGPRPSQTAGKALVLVVDDSITVRRVMERLLQRNNYRVVLAADGVEGLARLREERPAVVLSDIEMPNMDGYDLVRQIRSDPMLADLPVVMITSRAADKHRTYAMELGANEYLGKPYSEDELLKLLQDYTKNNGAASNDTKN